MGKKVEGAPATDLVARSADGVAHKSGADVRSGPGLGACGAEARSDVAGAVHIDAPGVALDGGVVQNLDAAGAPWARARFGAVSKSGAASSGDGVSGVAKVVQHGAPLISSVSMVHDNGQGNISLDKNGTTRKPSIWDSFDIKKLRNAVEKLTYHQPEVKEGVA
ncbi:hypothetical protein RIF29_24941 [Crotalaria pallida]|uniref:Uncharacterized protein n=1 Tax=Crotalaria pallida TaxID=3830 RepID=A0AAN9EKM2_CROPI